MTSLFALRALLTAGELFFASALIMMLAWFAASQKGAAARHLTWTGSLASLLALPVLVEIVPSAFRILLAAPPPQVPVAQMISDVAVPAALPEPIASGFSFDPSTIALALGALWLAGACVIALRFAIAALCLAALKRRSRPFALAPGDLPCVAATRRECELRLSQSEHGPVTWGVLHPVILLPKMAIFWPRERLHAVLLHELAHIRRRDSLAQALSLLVCALYWPNPLVWLGARALRREAEIAADDSVIVAGFKPSQYAGELLELAVEFRAQRPAFSVIPLSMAAPSALEARVKSVLAPTSVRSGVTSMDVLKIAGLGLLATTAIVFARPSLAQDTTPPPPPPAPIAAPEALPPPDAPPAPAALPALPPIPATPAMPSDPTHSTGADAADPSVHISVDGHERALTPSERAHIRVVIEKARHEAREAMAKARPEIEKAMVEVRASKEAMRNIQPQIDAAMAKVAKARPEIEKAVAEAKVSEQAVRDAQPQIDAAMAEVAKERPEIDRAMAEAQPQIDAALAKVREELAKDHLDANIQMRVDAALKRAEIRIEAVKAREHERTEERTEDRTTTDTPDND